ncbi:hypothetical protein QZH46_10790 [Pseudomonas corrugata]
MRETNRSTLTELSYDYRGNLSRKVTYGVVGADGTGSLESSTSVTEYIYSQHGQLLQTLVARGADRSQKTTLSSVVYDGLGRVISQTDSAGTRTTAYSGASRTVAVTNSAGMTVTQTYDSKGQLLSLTQTAAGQTPRSTSYVYDAAGRQVMVQDATGARSYTFYDEVGRVRAQVDGVGAVTEYSYNAAGQRVQEKRYATLIDTSTWYNGTAVVGDLNPVTNSADRLTTLSYDDAGRLSTRTDAIGTLTAFTYDGQGRLIQQQTGDRTTRFFYDASGHQSGQLDAEGYLRENRYDATGRLTQSIRYATQALAANRASGTSTSCARPLRMTCLAGISTTRRAARSAASMKSSSSPKRCMTKRAIPRRRFVTLRLTRLRFLTRRHLPPSRTPSRRGRHKQRPRFSTNRDG